MTFDLPRLQAAQSALVQRPLAEVLDVFVALARWLCDAGDPERQKLVEALEASTGLAPTMIDWGLRTTAGAWLGSAEQPRAAMESLLVAEFTYPAALDGWIPSAKAGEEMRWVPVPITLQLLPGNVFAAPMQQLFAGCIARTGQILKPATGGAPWLGLLIAKLTSIDAGVGAAVQIAAIDAHDASELEPLIAAADVITVSGDASAVEAITTLVQRQDSDGRERTLIDFGPRTSAAYIARYHWEDPTRLATVAAALAVDVCAYNQRGCLSPHIAFIEDCLPSDLPAIANAMFAALQQQSNDWPHAGSSVDEQASRRTILDARSMAGDLVLADATVAVVVSTESPTPARAGGRTLVLAPVGFPQGVLERLRPVQMQLGTLGVAVHPAVPLKGFRQSSGLFGKGPSGEPTGPGFNRLCPIGEMQTPRADEPHDGRPRVRLFMRRESRQAR